MTLLPRMFTLAEANALLPHLEAGVEQAKAAIVRAHALRAKLMKKLRGAGEEGFLRIEENHPELWAAIHAADEEAKAELELVQRLGVTLTSLDPLEASVPGRRGTLPVMLCYDAGDEGFRSWHALSEPRELRRPIDEEAAFGAELLFL